MRLEIRSSGGDTCPRCGSFELVEVRATGQPIAADFGAMVERLCQDREAALLEGVEAERERWRLRLETGAEQYEELLVAVRGCPAPRWRLFRRRWERDLAERVDAVVQASAVGSVESESRLRGV